MKIIHIPFCYYPGPIGGTEVYVEALARHLQALGVNVIVVAPDREHATYTHNGLRVRRYAVSPALADLRDLYGNGDAQAARGFARILDEERPDVVHLHAFTRGVSLRMVRAAKERDIPVVFTYHTPTVSCQRGTLMRWGSEVCDGVLDVQRCAACTLHGLGLSRPFAEMVSRLPTGVGHLLGAIGRSGGPWTALRMTELITLRHGAFRALMREVDRVVVLCRWTRDLLIRNGVPAEKIVVCRHGLPQQGAGSREQMLSEPLFSARDSSLHAPRSTLRIAFLGRLDPTKGPDLLIRAVRGLTGAPLKLHLYGVVQGEGGRQYEEALRDLAGDDPRIEFRPPVPASQVIPLLRAYDVLAVPSRWLETGPLVVLEAFAAGVPVLGARLGGIAEWVEDEENGLLVEPDSVESWRQALERLVRDRTLLERLRAGIRPPRTMSEVAKEMLTLYLSFYRGAHVST